MTFILYLSVLCRLHCVQQASRRFSIAERFLWDTLLLSETHCNALFWCEESTLQCSTAMTPSLSVLCTVSHITTKKNKSHLQVENVCKAEIYVWHYGDKGKAGGRLCFQDTHFHMKWQPLVFFPLPWEWDRDRWGLELIYIANVFGSNDDDTGTMWGGRLRTYLRESVRTRGKLPQVHIEVFIICVLFLCLQMMVSLRASCERGEHYIL